MGEALSNTDKRFRFMLFWCNLIRYHRHSVSFLNRDAVKVDKIFQVPKAKADGKIFVFACDTAFFVQLKEIRQRKEKNFFSFFLAVWF